MMRFVPPAGTPLKVTQILSSVIAAIPMNGDAPKLLRSVGARLQVEHIYGTSSGRAALWLALRGLHRLRPDRNVVAVPAYTCFSVPAAVVRAGLKIYPVDVNPKTLDFDPDQLRSLPKEKLLCIVPCNLFGFPNDISVIREVAAAKDAYVLEDAAQALGSTRNGKLAGTAGDVGIFSLGRGKSLGSVAGGLLVTNSDEIAAAIQSEQKSLGAAKTSEGAVLLSKMVSYAFLLHPRLYWIPNSLPFLKLGVTEYEPAFPVSGLHPISLVQLQNSLDELEEVNQVRQKNAKAIAAAVQGNPNLESPRPGAMTEPTFVRFPVLACDQSTRDRALTQLRDAGIGATGFYPSAICDIPGIESHMSDRSFHRVHAEDLSRRLLTLPVHPFVKPQDLDRMAEILAHL